MVHCVYLLVYCRSAGDRGFVSNDDITSRDLAVFRTCFQEKERDSKRICQEFAAEGYNCHSALIILGKCKGKYGKRGPHATAATLEQLQKYHQNKMELDRDRRDSQSNHAMKTSSICCIKSKSGPIEHAFYRFC